MLELGDADARAGIADDAIELRDRAAIRRGGAHRGMCTGRAAERERQEGGVEEGVRTGFGSSTGTIPPGGAETGERT